jgi:Ran GTPase-activating protein (RanGAP) involved in mRNA processing and transport
METSMVEADFGGKYLGTSGAIMVAAFLPKCTALSVLSLKGNSLGVDGGKALAGVLKGNTVITELNIADNGLTDRGRDMSGIITIADAIPNMRALSVLSLKSNNLRANGGKALAEGLKGNQVITELNIADNNLTSDGNDMSGVIALADVIPDMGAMTSLSLASNVLSVEGAKVIAACLPKCTAMTKLDFSNNYKNTAGQGYAYMSEEFIRPIASMLKTNTSITELNVSSNWLNAEAAEILADGISDNGALTSLDVSDTNLGKLVPPSTLPAGWNGPDRYGDFAGPNGEDTKTPPGSMPLGVIALAKAIPDMGALLVLSLKENGLGTKESGKVLGEMLKANSVLKKLDLSSNCVSPDYGGDGPGFAQGIAAGISDNRVLLSLNISDNKLSGIHVHSDGVQTGTYNAAGNSDSIDLNVTYSYCV